jgi:hypothetical protein
MSCHDNLELFRQHSGECWNDAIQVFFLLSADLGPRVRDMLGRAAAIESFTAWLTSPSIQTWLQHTFQLPADHTPAFNRLAISYIRCFRDRINNWNIQRRAKQSNAGRRKASQVLSLCSAASAMYASELLWSPADSAAMGRPTLLTPELLASLQAGTIDPGANAAMGREAERVQKGYSLWSAARFMRVLSYYFLKRDYFVSVEDLNAVPVSTFRKRPLLVADFRIGFADAVTIYQGIKDTHTVNVFTSGFNLLKGVHHPVGHQIYMVSCDSATRDEYIYDDNAHMLQKVKWSRVFEPGAQSRYLRWKGEETDERVVQRILVMHFSAQAFVTAGRRTTEKMRENYHRLARQEEDPLLKHPMTYYANCLDTIDLHTRTEDKQAFFGIIGVDISKGAAPLREDLLDFIKLHYDSPLIKIFTDFRPVLIVSVADKYYFFNNTGYMLLTDAQLQADGLTVAGTLFCEDSVEKYLHLLATAFHTCKGFYEVRYAEVFWATPRPLAAGLRSTRKASSNRSHLRSSSRRAQTHARDRTAGRPTRAAGSHTG